MPEISPRELLLGAFQAGVAAIQAEAVLPRWLPAPPQGRTLVVGAGKAAAAMAASVEAHWPGPVHGLVITRRGHDTLSHTRSRQIEVIEAGHPLPDAAGIEAAERLLALLQTASADDRVIALISGGGSSLLSLPAEGLCLADLQVVGQALLRSGAPIAEINCVRKHLSRSLGGRLAQACRAPVTALLISDVVGDDVSVIASGPFAPDPTRFPDALAVLERWQVVAPPAVVAYLQRGAVGELPETPKPGDACFARVEHQIVANGRTALLAAAEHFRRNGVRPVILGDSISGEAREVAQVFAALAREVRLHGGPWQAPVALLSGGETSVTVRGGGRGGRNTEFLLGLALALEGLAGVHALAADTDGIDGTEDNAGAVIGPDTLARARHLGLDPRALLAGNDAYAGFAALDDLVLTGPTRTNANDFRAILIA